MHKSTLSGLIAVMMFCFMISDHGVANVMKGAFPPNPDHGVLSDVTGVLGQAAPLTRVTREEMVEFARCLAVASDANYDPHLVAEVLNHVGATCKCKAVAIAQSCATTPPRRRPHAAD